METSAAPAITATTWPGCPSRLLGDRPGQIGENYPAYRELGGYRSLADPGELLGEVERSGLQGRGGAAFPLAVKLRAVRDNGRLTGGRWHRRHRERRRGGTGVDQGPVVATAPAAPGARRAAAGRGNRGGRPRLRLCVRPGICSQRRNRDEPNRAFGDIAVELWQVDPGYIAGEETAVTRAINGGPVKPTDKPPRPFEAGVGGRPTLVSNVETLANLPYLQHHGSAAFRSLGTSMSPGTFLVTLTGASRPPALYEIPHGLPFTELLALHGVSSEQVRGALLGGYFAGLLNRAVLEATLDHETLRGLGSGLGCGAITVITDDCPVAVAASVLAYFDRENAGQCGSCFNGTAAMAAVAGALRDGVATSEDLSRLRRWSVVLRGRGACATLDAATNVAGSLLDQFPHEVAHHLGNACEPCRAHAFRAERPYEVEAVIPA